MLISWAGQVSMPYVRGNNQRFLRQAVGSNGLLRLHCTKLKNNNLLYCHCNILYAAFFKFRKERQVPTYHENVKKTLATGR